jgi:hypothetical protein
VGEQHVRRLYEHRHQSVYRAEVRIMGYAIHARDGAWPPNAPVDGESIAWHYRASQEECEGGEVYVEELPDGLSEPRWDASESKPRFRSEEELAEVEREATTLRIAGEAQEALGSIFVNPNDALVMVAAALHKLSQGESLRLKRAKLSEYSAGLTRGV